MHRPRLTNQQMFQSEVQRLQNERSELLKQRNQTELTKQSFYKKHQPNYDEPHPINRKHFPIQGHFRHLEATNRKPNTDIVQLKMMLEDIMRNCEKHGMDHRMSIGYLSEIQSKLQHQIDILEFNNVMRSPKITKLKDLKQFIDRLIEMNAGQQVIAKNNIQKIKSTQQVTKKTLQKIPEGLNPSIASSSKNIESGSDAVSEISSSIKVTSDQRLPSDFNINYPKDHIDKKYPGNTQILQKLQQRIFEQVAKLRNQNQRLKRQISSQTRTNKSSESRLKIYNMGQNQTIINNLHKDNLKNLEMENVRLKNKIRSLEMELLNWKSLRHIDISSRKSLTEQKLYEQLELKDDEIKGLRKQIQSLVIHLQNNKQYVQSLKQQISQLQQKQRQRVQILNHQKKRNPEAFRRTTATQLKISSRSQLPESNNENRTDTLNRNYSNFGEKGCKLQSNELSNKRTEISRKWQKDSHEDKIGEYRKLLTSLKTIKK